jgi:hypothetical protein
MRPDDCPEGHGSGAGERYTWWVRFRAKKRPGSDADTDAAADAGASSAPMVSNAEMCRLVQRIAESDVDATVPGEFAGQVRSQEGRGRPLPQEVRQDLESGLGTQLPDVRLHVDDSAAKLATQVSAQAFTVGQDIYFGQGKYDPQSQGGFRLLAHEATHTLQRTPAGDGMTVSSPHDPAERQAERVADQVAAGRPVGDFAAAGSAHVHRFGSDEHVQIGDASAGTGQGTSLRYGDGPTEVLRFGEVIALSGDYFESLAEMEGLSGTPAGRQQIRYARWYALHPRGESEPSVGDDIKTAVKNRYFNLAARNTSHFSGGGEAGSTYEDGHRLALRRAFFAGMHGSVDEMKSAMTAEGAAQHYLTDMFSGGHVRTPRRDIKQWYQSNFPDSPEQLKDLLVNRLLKHLNDIDKAQLGNIPDFLIRPKVERIVENLAGPAIRSFSLGDIVSLALHNYDNDQGVEVTSASNPAPWTAFGDGNLNHPAPVAGRPTTLSMVVAASRASIVELERAAQAGRTATAGGSPDAMADAAVGAIRPYAALAFVPHATANNVPVTGVAADAGDTSLTWHWGSFTSGTRKAVGDTVSGEIAGMVLGLARTIGDASGVIDNDAGWPIGVLHLHARTAVERIGDELKKRGIAVIIEAIGSDPGSGSVTAGLPQDAGVAAGVP